ncbi:MAG: hypothetical protein IJ112_03110 [Oscillospiraceae bacterium]|nr:hypothetical protein [Oscillospiraceae bacterium]
MRRNHVLYVCLLLAALMLVGCTATKGSVKVRQGNALSKTVELSTLQTQPVKGVSQDANGDKVEIDTVGVLVSDVLTAGDIDPSWIGDVSVETRDKQTAEVTGSELNMADKAYLTPEDDGTWSLVILGESDGCVLKDVVFLHAQNI